MRFINKTRTVGLLIILCIVVCLFSVELYLHTKQAQNDQLDMNNWRLPLTVCTLEGQRITKEDGLLRLGLAPYTIYKNLPNQKTAKFTINSSGFRGGNVSTVPDNRIRTIVVGGSAAFGISLENDDETFEALLEKLDSKFEVINAGVAGFLSGQELTYIVTELADYHPQVIIAYNGWNDLQESWYHKTWWNKQKEKAEMGYNTNFFIHNIEHKLVDNYQTQVSLSRSFSRFFNTLVDKSSLISLLRNQILKLKQQKVLNKQSGTSEHILQNDYMNAIIGTYVDNLIKMDKFCKSLGIKFVVIFQPELGLKVNKSLIEREILATWQFGSSNYQYEFPSLYRTFIDRSKKLLIKNAVDCLDINAETEFKNNSHTLFHDVVHTNKSGNEIIAKVINQHLNMLF